METEQKIVIYKSGGLHFTSLERRFRKEAAKLARKGWRVKDTAATRGTANTSGQLIVTYEREKEDRSR